MQLAEVKTLPKPAPRGEKVRELTESLERSLSFGSAVKKPAGGVSLHFQGNDDERSEPPRSTVQKSSRQQVRSMRSGVFVFVFFLFVSCCINQSVFLIRYSHFERVSIECRKQLCNCFGFALLRFVTG